MDAGEHATIAPLGVRKELAVIVERMLIDASNIKRLADQYSNRDHGQLIVVTTHTQARYALPQVVTQFKNAFPKVHLLLHQASPNEIVSMLQAGEADIGIATEALDSTPEDPKLLAALEQIEERREDWSTLQEVLLRRMGTVEGAAQIPVLFRIAKSLDQLNVGD